MLASALAVSYPTSALLPSAMIAWWNSMASARSRCHGAVNPTSSSRGSLASVIRCLPRAMRGLMMDYQLSIPAIIRRADALFATSGWSHAAAGPEPRPPLVRPDRGPRRSAWPRPCRPRRPPGRPGGHARLGEPSAPRGLPRDPLRSAPCCTPSTSAFTTTTCPTSSTTRRTRVLLVDESLLPLFEKFRRAGEPPSTSW